MQKLEKEYGVRLFDRIGNRIQLTRAGQFLLDHACKIIDAYQNLDFDMKKLTAKSEGELRIGASTTISQYVLPGLFAEIVPANMSTDDHEHGYARPIRWV